MSIYLVITMPFRWKLIDNIQIIYGLFSTGILSTNQGRLSNKNKHHSLKNKKTKVVQDLKFGH